jgi:hypothetical protein
MRPQAIIRSPEIKRLIRCFMGKLYGIFKCNQEAWADVD